MSKERTPILKERKRESEPGLFVVSARGKNRPRKMGVEEERI